jgi:hypothetical protein
MTINENVTVNEEGEDGSWKKRKISPEEAQKLKDAFGRVDLSSLVRTADRLNESLLANKPLMDLSSIYQLAKLNTVSDSLNKIKQMDLITSDTFSKLNEFSKVVTKLDGQISQMKQTALQLSSIIQTQNAFRDSIFQVLSKSTKLDSIIGTLTKEWTQTLVFFKADISGLKFDVSYQKKTYTEKRQLVVELDNSKVENGLEVYQTFEKDGQRYKLVAIPENNFVEFSQATTTLAYSDNQQTASISTFFPVKSKKNKSTKFRYDPKKYTLFVGNHSHTLSFSKSFHFLNHCLIEIHKDKDKTVWYFSDLFDTFDSEVLNTKEDKKVLKDCKNWFDYFKKSLVSEIQDLFIVGNKYIKINCKYR